MYAYWILAGWTALNFIVYVVTDQDNEDSRLAHLTIFSVSLIALAIIERL